MLNKFIILFLFIYLAGCREGFERECANTFGRWDSLPIRLHPINLSSSELEVLKSAVQLWNVNMNREMFVLTSNTNNTVTMGVLNLPKSAQGVTHIDGRYPYIYGASIEVSMYYQLNLKAIYVHEMGHAMGLDHIEGTIMNSSSPYRYYNDIIEPEVIKAAQCLYNQ